MFVTANGTCRASTNVVELRQQAKAVADRKVMRFLTGVELPPFVAATNLIVNRADVHRDDIGLYTVSGWEAKAPPIQGTYDGSEDVARALAEEFRNRVTPTDWLRDMGNNALCQIAIATSVRGPNCHYVGDGATMQTVLGLAQQTLVEEAARVVIAVAFDVNAGEDDLERDERPATAVALALEAGHGPSNQERVELDVDDGAHLHDVDAVTVLGAWLRAIDSASERPAPVMCGDVQLGLVTLTAR